MALPTLPEEILVKIASNVAKDKFWHLGPLVMAGTQGRDLVYRNSEILRGACIYSLCTHGGDITIGGRYRPFFVRCVENENPIALYHEGIRLATEEGNIKRALLLFDKIVDRDGHAALAAAIFCICSGQIEKAGRYLCILSNTHKVGLKSDEIEEMGRALLFDIRSFKATHTRRYLRTLKFPICEIYPIPACVQNGHHLYTPGLYEHCYDCYVWSLAVHVYWIL